MTISLTLKQVSQLFPEPTLALRLDTQEIAFNTAWSSSFAASKTEENDTFWPFGEPDQCDVIQVLRVAISKQDPTVSLPVSDPELKDIKQTSFDLLVAGNGSIAILKVNRRARPQSKVGHDKQLDNDAFTQRVNAAIHHCSTDEKYQFALLLIDIDQFRMIADQSNNLSTDLIEPCAQVLADNLRDKDHFVHLQNDQFCVFADNVKDPSHVLRLAERIQESFQVGISVNNECISITASIGISLGNVGHASAEHIMHDADIAMYRAKLNGKGRYEIFDRAQYEHSVEVLELERDIRIAFDKQQFSLLYEPIIDVGENTTAGIVPRICWNHPKFGELRSEHFLNLAENQNLIELLTNLRINNGCLQLTQWRQQLSSPPAWINIPLRSTHSMRPELIEQLLQALQQSQLDAPDIYFCISASVLSTSPATAIATINQLKALEIKVGLNDFGDKNSSILDLHRCAFDFVMTAPCLLENAHGVETLKSIRVLTKRLNQKLIVTNVTAPYAELIKKLEIDYASGSIYHAAADAATLGKYLNAPKQVA